jgi:DNA-binding NtrC family response regulator
VDDDPSVLAVVSRALRDDGHEVISVSNGQVACDVVLDESIDVVVTNSCLPGLSGAELMQGLRERIPGLPILHMGDHLKAAHPEFRVPDDVLTLFKPYDLTALKAAVRRILKPLRPSQPEYLVSQ